tara:strand:+ start:21157 stop:22275 length:1119 start_codon:yes stop_codon:yes gene_type:complete
LTGSPSLAKDRKVIVLIQLVGGNDGLNTVVPFRDSNYFRLRPTLALTEKELIPVSKNLALNSALKQLAELHLDGKVSIIQNVGYPNPNRSHFRSSEIWETASDSDEFVSTGWLGRYFDNHCTNGSSSDHPLAIHIGKQLPQTFRSSESHIISGSTREFQRSVRDNLVDLYGNLPTSSTHGENLKSLQHRLRKRVVTEEKIRFITEKYLPHIDYPRSRLSADLKSVAALIVGGLETRVFFVSQSGYDTHTNQANPHRRLLQELSSAMAAFQKDLAANHLENQVLTLTFSEFGRRPRENTNGGTDHGTGAPLFVMGSQINKGIVGTAPSLDLDPTQDLQFSTDFRQVYSTILEKWLQCSSHCILTRTFSPLDFI